MQAAQTQIISAENNAGKVIFLIFAPASIITGAAKSTFIAAYKIPPPIPAIGRGASG